MTDAVDIRQAFNALNKTLTPGDTDGTDVLSALNKLTVSLATFAAANTGPQTIALTGDVTGSGTGTFAATIGAGKVTAAKIANAALKIYTFVGVDASGGAAQATLTGAKIGDVVVGIVNLTDEALETSHFETVITVADKIVQNETDLTTKNLMILMIAKGA